MAQITIYLDQETAAKLRAFVQAKRISQSQWIAGLIRAELATEWPDSVVELAGAWQAFPTAEELRAAQGQDAAREPL